MKKRTKKKWVTAAILIAAVITTVEFQKFMKRQVPACKNGVCAVPPEYAAAQVTGPQNVPLPVTADKKNERVLPRLINFGAEQNATCKIMDVVLDELAQAAGEKLVVQYIDVNEQKDLTKQHAIRMIPTQIFLDAQGKELFRYEGFISKEDILKKWAELGIHL